MNLLPAYCVLPAPLAEADCRAWLDHALGGPPPDAAVELRWLLGHCDEGIVWGRREGSSWQLSSVPFAKVSPRLEPHNLQQLRLFGPTEEVLLWRGEGLCGRRLADGPAAVVDDPLRPETQDVILVGDQVLEEARQGFTLVGDPRGSRQAVPLECSVSEMRRHPLRLRVRHYFAADPESGLVRICASRLVNVFLKPREGP